MNSLTFFHSPNHEVILTRGENQPCNGFIERWNIGPMSPGKRCQVRGKIRPLHRAREKARKPRDDDLSLNKLCMFYSTSAFCLI